MFDHASQKKWDSRYRQKISTPPSIADILQRHHHLLPDKGEALDLACGLGGNALFLASHGLQVSAWDISPVAIERLQQRATEQGLSLNTETRDCVACPPTANSLDLIVVSRFLVRTLCPALQAALRPGGLLFYQTYLQQPGIDNGPHNPDFLLKHDELPRLFSALQPLLYRETDRLSDGRAEAQLVAQRPLDTP